MAKDPFLGYSTMRTGKEREVAHNRRKRDAASVATSQAEDPRINQAQKELGVRLADYRERNPALNRTTGREMQKLVEDFRSTCRRKGIELPSMVVVYFLRMNHICVWPRELEAAEIQKRLHLFIVHRQRHGRTVDAEDLAMGVRRAYPDYSPSRHLILPKSITDANQQETVQ